MHETESHTRNAARMPGGFSLDLAPCTARGMSIALAAMLALGSTLQAADAAPPAAPTAGNGELDRRTLSDGVDADAGWDFGEPIDEDIPEPAIVPATLGWTPHPGAFETDLQRRNANPLYPRSRQIVTEAELRDAKTRDAADEWKVLDTFIEVQLDKKSLSRSSTVREIDDALRRISRVMRAALEVGGEGDRLIQPLAALRVELIAAWRERNADESAVLDRLAGIENSGELNDLKTRDEFVAQLLREKGPILAEEQAAAILSEAPDSIARAMSILTDRRRKAIRADGVERVRALELEGFVLEAREAKLAALMGKRRTR
jgi:hypothetical protein